MNDRSTLRRIGLVASLSALTLGCVSLMPLMASAAPAKKAAAKPKVVPEKIEYERDIKPIFAEHCMSCHGPDKAKGGLKLTDRASAMAKTKKGHIALVPGKPDDSELIKRVTTTDTDLRMPPAEDHEPLAAVDIAILKKWIAQGADWQAHWAFAPLKKPVPPQVKNGGAVKNPVDQFILAELEKRSIAPSPEADRYTQIKRLSYDLIGLPPTPAEVDAFVHDTSSRAYENLVERLLASPHFGELWGRHWLDKARYADSDGYEKDRARPDAYVYRDWVINALNNDMPFDQFTIEQIAGDLLPGAKPSQKIATAFNRQTLTNEEGGVDQEEYRVAAIFDRVDTLGAVWLGLTVGCAKCHNHKYDPITQVDYYSMFAFFNNSDEVSVKLPVKAADMSGYEAKVAPLEQALAARRKEIAPAEQEWEVAERAKLLKTAKAPQQRTPLKLVSYEAVNGTSLTKPKGDVILATGPSPATDTYIITATTSEKDLTGFRLEVYADEALPAKGPGRAPNGNFVLTAFRAFIVDESGKQTPITLQRAEAKFSQPGFDAANAIGSTAAQPLTRKEKAKLAKQGKAVVEKAAEEPGGKKKGWATLGKTGETNMLTVRTTAPLTLAAGQSLRFELEQDYGNKHTIGRFALFGITGDSRGLHLPANIVADLDMYPEKRVASTKAELFDYFASQDDQVKSLQQQIAAAQKEFKVETMAVRTIGASLRKRVSHVFERGDFLSPAAEVSPNTLGALPPLKASGKVATRLDLARWLVSPDNMLTPRVAVNQVWTQLFGAGLVTTVNDFGVRGERPSHPELLDWLAATYRDDLKWSLKGLIRTIVNSATYRQSSRHRTELVEVDPLNTLLARQNRIRVQGEVVRDLALSVSGLLSPKIGGPSVFPPMPEDLAKLSYANNFSWKTSAGEDKYRRGMYTFFKRTIPHPTLMTFDCPEANTTCVVRNISNTPLQALTLLNNDAFVEASQALARRVLSEGSTDDRDRLSRALKLALVREPGAEDISRLSDLLTASREYYKAHPDAAKQLAGKPLPPGDTSGGETAAWTATLRVILNLDEFITRE